jgi:hypothetical protein
MDERHEVISAFLDDEPFDASVLMQALGEPGGRQLLIDLVALRHLVLADGQDAAIVTRRPRRAVLPALVAAAAVVVALVGGYVAGERRGQLGTLEPPAATRVVDAPSEWQVVLPGRTR